MGTQRNMEINKDKEMNKDKERNKDKDMDLDVEMGTDMEDMDMDLEMDTDMNREMYQERYRIEKACMGSYYTKMFCKKSTKINKNCFDLTCTILK